MSICYVFIAQNQEFDNFPNINHSSEVSIIYKIQYKKETIPFAHILFYKNKIDNYR